MVKSQLRHGNDLLAMDSLRECDVCIYCLLYTFALARCNNSSSLSPGQTRKHCFLPMFRHVSKSGQTLGNISEKHQMFLNLLGNIFASREANFVSATMFPWVGKRGNI